MVEKEEKSIRVVDRRMFTADGELRPDFEPEEPPAASAPAPAAPAPAAPLAPPETASAATPSSTSAGPAGGDAASNGNAVDLPSDEEEEGEAPGEGQPAEEPRGAFSAIVRSLATTAYSALGLLGDPAAARHRDPAVARQMIDWLAVLESKTRNNLSFEESDFLSRVLYELRLAFVEVTRPPGAAR